MLRKTEGATYVEEIDIGKGLRMRSGMDGRDFEIDRWKRKDSRRVRGASDRSDRCSGGPVRTEPVL